jgi:hypothetical protein
MPSYLKGNFTPRNEVTADEAIPADDLEQRFEREALKRLGGSIAFVSKKKVKWSQDQ